MPNESLGRGERQVIIRLVVVGVLLIGLTIGSLVMWHWRLDTAPREMLMTPSPSPGRRWQASAFVDHGRGAAGGSRYEVRLAPLDERPEFGEPVWKSSGVPPAALEWHGDDSLIVVVRDQPEQREDAASVEVRASHGVDVRTVARPAPSTTPTSGPPHHR